MSQPADAEFQLGQVLGRGFAMLARFAVPFTGMALLIFAPVVVLLALADDPLAVLLPAEVTAAGLLLHLIESALSDMLTAAMVYGIIACLRGAAPSGLECVLRGLPAALPVIGLVIVINLAVLVGLYPFVLPGLIIAALLWVAVPAAVVEETGIVDSLRRSLELTQGHRWKVFGLVVLLVACSIAFDEALNRMVLASDGGPDGMAQESQAVDWRVALAVEYLGLVAVSLVWSAMVVVSYHDLRIAKEGAEAKDVAKVFD